MLRKILFSSLLFLLLSCNRENKNGDVSQNSIPPDSSVPKNAPNQNITSVVPSFTKYSYKLFLKNTLDTNGNAFATGFFIKRNNRIILLSNYHVFANCNTYTKETPKYPCDSLMVVYPTISGVGLIRINLKEFRKKNPPIYDYERADIYAVDVTNQLQSGAILNSIEDFYKPIPIGVNPKMIFSTGYGAADLSQTQTNFNFTIKTTMWESYRQKYSNGIHPNSNAYIVSPAISPGMSGSPVFYQLNDNPSSIVFGGVAASHFALANMSVIVKPSEVEKEIQRALKRKG